MKPSRRIFVSVAVAALLLGALIWSRTPPAPLTAPPASTPTPSANTVTISAQQQAASGIEVQALAATQFQPHSAAYASVPDMSALFQLRGQLRAAQAQTDAAHAQATVAQREYQRLATLNRQDQTVSDKATEAALASQQAARAQLDAAQATLAATGDAARSRWGAVLTDWAAKLHAPQLDALTAGQQAVLLVALPQGTAVAPPLIRIQTDTGTRSARLLSAAPLADPVIQRATYFYLTARGGLRSGMRIEAELPAGQTQAGVAIPEAAVVWYANQPWVYVQRDSTHFVRRPLADATATSSGWFVAWRAGERVVVKGAALLLSQELQPATPASPTAGGDDDD